MTLLRRRIHPYGQRCSPLPPLLNLPMGHPGTLAFFSLQWGKCLRQVLVQSGLILFCWEQVIPAASHNLLAYFSLRQQSVRHHYPAIQRNPAQYFFGRRQFLSFTPNPPKEGVGSAS